ncbi:MAG: tetratricopeptide repeat protein [Bacteroidia bacterium]
MSQSKNNLLAGAGLAIALAMAVYFIFSKFSKPESQTSEYSYLKSNSETNSLEKENIANDSPEFFKNQPVDSNILIEATNIKGEDLASFEDIDAEMQIIFNRIDKRLDKAHRIKTGLKKRDILLSETETLIDSALLVYNNPFFNVSLGDLKMLQGKNTDAVKQYEVAMLKLGNLESIRRNHAGACYNAAIEMINANDTDQAIKLMETFHAFAPNDENGQAILVDWYTKRSVGLLRVGKNQQGLALCQKAIAINAFEHAPHFNAGIAHFRMRNYDKAIKQFESCLELNANDQYSKNYLYTIYMNQGNVNKAKEYETEAINVELPVD